MGLKLLSLILLAAALAAAQAQPLPGCLNKCGNVDIPYPFGVGVQPHTGRNCFLEESFNLTCDNSILLYGNLPISNISLQGQLDISMPVSKICYNELGVDLNVSWLLGTAAFTISSTANKFVSIGCDTYGYLNSFQNDRNYSTGCLSRCNTLPMVKNISETCSGIGCCQVDIPVGMRNISYQAFSFNNHARVLDFNNCSYAFVAKQGSFRFSHEYLYNLPLNTTLSQVDWTVSNVSCQSASNTPHYACKGNTDCADSSDGLGYNCRCKTGFGGNPYHPDGCHDVDECSLPNPCSMPMQCHNFDGGYNCSCPPGYKGDGYINGTRCTLDSQSNHNLLILIIALGFSVALLVVFTLVSTLCWVHKQRTLKQLRQRNFEQNGGNMLLQQLSQWQECTNRTKIFTEVELKNATNNFDEGRILGRGGQGTVYKGILPDNTPVAIKKSRVGEDPRQIKDFINEVVVLSQINHRNVVKLLGCCLETEVPLLVYEFVDNGTLLGHIDPLKNKCSIPWETRLRIAADTAEAIAYLHSAASIPIIHRDIKSTNILLDHNHGAKVSDFGASRLVPLDETQVTTVVQGTLGYLDPEYLHTGQLNEKSDVYSFGVVLVELLTGNKAVEFNRPEQRNLAMCFVSSMKEERLWQILDGRVLDQKNNPEQLKEVALLARKCLRVKGEERPTMKEVAMELEGLIVMEKHHWVKGKDLTSEESEYLLGHVPDGYGGASASNSAGYDSIWKQIAFEIADGR